MAFAEAPTKHEAVLPGLLERLRLTRGERRNLLVGLAFISPWIVGFIAFLVYPIYYTIKLSFTRYSGFGTPTPIGLFNYHRLLHNDPLFWKALYNSAYFTVLAVPIGVVVALVLALAMNQPLPEVPVFRAIFFVPSVLPLFAISFIVLTLLDPNTGVVNRLLHLVHLPTPFWFGNPSLAKFSLVLMAQYGAGQWALVFLAGLKGIPTSLYEAAMLDGASTWNKFRSITLPLLTPVIFFDLVLGLGLDFQVFTQSYIITQGGPADATNFFVYYLYNNAFRYSQMGYAAALSCVLFAITLVVALVIFLTSSKWVHYEYT